MSDFSLEQLLGGISPETFLAEYWQKKPLLVRQALPGFGDWLDCESLSELARHDDAESRLVGPHFDSYDVSSPPATHSDQGDGVADTAGVVHRGPPVAGHSPLNSVCGGGKIYL